MLYIETVKLPHPPPKGEGEGESGRGSLTVTGHLGDVMKESTQIAYTFAKASWAFCLTFSIVQAVVSVAVSSLSAALQVVLYLPLCAF